jgi:murein L,D-transpeptidase YcbB/YkuD
MELIMRSSYFSLSSLSAALLCCGVMSAQAAVGTYYDPTNEAANAGKTIGYELYKTIGCPGKGLLDPGCTVQQPVAPAPKPAAKTPDCPLPVGALSGDKMPTNAKAGQCFAKVVRPATFRTESERKLVKEAGEKIDTLPAKYETVKERVLVKEASEKIEILPPVYKAVKVRVQSEEIQEVVPAVYETVMEKVLVKEASTRLEEVPAVYEDVEEKVLVKPASKKAIEIPAVYETVTEKKLVREAFTTWKPGTQTNIQKVDEATGQIMCLVEVPAVYEDVSRQVIKTPASVRYEDIPAEYQTVKKTVLKSPATTRTIQIPAEYAEREVKKLVKPATTVTKVVPVDYEREIMTVVQPATEKRIPIPAEYTEREVTKLVAPAKEVRVPIPAEYTDVPKEVMVCPVQTYWTEVLCDVNATPAKVAEIQNALRQAGFYNAPSNGKLDDATMKAIADFQKSKGLPVDGYVNMATVKALGVSPQ